MTARRKIGLMDLAEKMNITPENLSILKNGKAKAIRFMGGEIFSEIFINK